MAKTVVGLFDDQRTAQRAVLELINGGIPREDIGLTSGDYTGAGSGRPGSVEGDVRNHDEGIGERINNFFSSLFGGEDDARHYTDAVSRGGFVVTVDADTDDLADRAAAVMDRRYGADVDERGGVTSDRAATTTSGVMGQDVNTAAYNVGQTSREGAQQQQYRDSSSNQGEVAIPVIEEQLQVGKREVERGGVRVSSRVIERPVEEVVRLREERVRVERRPVNRPVTDADLQAFNEGVIEVSETSEEAVVGKQARVVEEVVVGKEVGQRTETVRDTLRGTDVQVEELGTDITRDDVRTRGTGGSGD
jgi:uncharacterized protein (TIGR02271 family)